MDIVLENGDCDDHLEAFDKLVSLGARRFVLRGVNQDCLRFAGAVGKKYSSDSITIVLCDNNSSLRQNSLDVRAPEEAYADDCEAVIHFCRKNIDDALNELEAFPSIAHVVYARQKQNKILVVSLQKCGTHMMFDVMKNIGFQKIYPAHNNIVADKNELANMEPNNCAIYHNLVLEYERPDIAQEIVNGDISIIFNYRDLRAALVSYANYMCDTKFDDKRQVDPLNILKASAIRKVSDGKKRIMLSALDLGKSFRDHAYLLFSPYVLPVRYEHLVGSLGGGCDIKQKQVITRMLRYLHRGGDAGSIGAGIYNPESPTFNTAKIDSWKKYMDPESEEWLSSNYRDILEFYSYEKWPLPDAPVWPGH